MLVAAGLTMTGATPAARQQTGTCVASYSFDRLTVIQDSDDDAVFATPDHWTIHTYVYVHTASLGTQIGNGSEVNFGVLKGDTGAVIPVGWNDLDHVVVGAAGEDVTVWMAAGSKANRAAEDDPQNGTQGVYPKDVNPYSIPQTVIAGCQPGSYPFSTQDQIAANPGGVAGEHDALIQLDFTLTLGNG